VLSLARRSFGLPFFAEVTLLTCWKFENLEIMFQWSSIKVKRTFVQVFSLVLFVMILAWVKAFQQMLAMVFVVYIQSYSSKFVELQN
jgi:hypothetical protein